MSKYRVANYHILKVKLDGRPAAEQAPSIDTLHQIMCELLELTARRHYGEIAEELAIDAAPLAISRIRRCLWSNVAYSLLWGTLSETFRRRTAMLARAANVVEAAPPGTPLLLDALNGLFSLAHRSWAYALLFRLRDSQAGWKKRLSELYLGVTPSGHGRQASLTRGFARFERLVGELELAYLSLSPRAAPKDPVEKWLLGLDSLIRVGSLDLTQPAGWRSLAAALLSSSAIAAANSIEYSEVAALLKQIQHLVESRSASAIDLENAAEELEGLFRNSLSNPRPPAPALFVWLDALPPDHRQEATPGDLLAELLRRPFSTGATSPEEVLNLPSLVHGMLAQLEPSSPQEAILACLVFGQSFDEICNKLGEIIPGPASMPGDLLLDVGSRLREWEETGRRWLSGNNGRACLSFDCQDMPRRVRESLDVEAIQEARELVGEWLEAREQRPHEWEGVQPRPELPIRGALLTVYLDELVLCLRQCYHQSPATDSNDVLPP